MSDRKMTYAGIIQLIVECRKQTELGDGAWREAQQRRLLKLIEMR